MTRRTWACGLTQKAWAFCTVAQHRHRGRGRCAKPAQDGAELLTLPIRLDRDAAEQLPIPSVVARASQHDLERSHLIASDRLHMAAVDRHRDRLNGCWGRQWLSGQNLLLQSRANPKGSPADRFDRGRLVQRKEFRHRRRRAAISCQAPHPGENAFIFWRASVGHHFDQRTYDPARGDPAAAGIEARGLDLNDPEQCRQLPSAPVLDGATGAAVRTGPPMLTISIGLRLNQLGLHRGENGLALSQISPIAAGDIAIAGWRPVTNSRVSTFPFASVSSSKTRHFISFPTPINDPEPIAPPSSRRSQGMETVSPPLR